LLAPPIPRIDQVGVNGIALGFAVALGIVAGLAFGTVPSMLAARNPIGSVLRASGRTSTAKARRFQKSVVALEIALTAVILVTGGLLTRSLSQLLSVDPGFDATNLATVHVSLPDSRYETQESQATFVNEVLREMEVIPGIQVATAANNLPFPGTTAGWGVRGENVDPDAPRMSAKLFHVVPGFHEAMGIRLVDGRTFTSNDGPDAPSVALISEEFARRMWPGTSPIGLRVRYPWTTVTVVGIVQDVRRETLGAAPELVFYVPYAQFTRPDVSFAVRTIGDPASVVPRMRDAVWSVDDGLAITHSDTMDSLISRSASDERYRTILMAVFGLLASALAAVGVFGVTARSVSFQTKEMGIRMALGQRRSGMVANILRGSLALCTLGTLAGTAVAIWASKAVSGLLFGVETTDPFTYAAVAGSLLVLSLVASYLPARRITRVDPVEVLRAE
jgi:predicted permease